LVSGEVGGDSIEEASVEVSGVGTELTAETSESEPEILDDDETLRISGALKDNMLVVERSSTGAEILCRTLGWLFTL